MTSNDAYNIALKLGELASKSVQFFIAICALFGGWALVGGTITCLDKYGFSRIMIAVAFLVPTSGIVYSVVSALRRSNAALILSKELIEKEGREFSDAVNKLHKPADIMVAKTAMILTIAIICFIVLYHTNDDVCTSSTSSHPPPRQVSAASDNTADYSDFRRLEGISAA